MLLTAGSQAMRSSGPSPVVDPFVEGIYADAPPNSCSLEWIVFIKINYFLLGGRFEDEQRTDHCFIVVGKEGTGNDCLHRTR